MRRKIVAGNWKMNMLPNETMDFINKIEPKIEEANAEVILCVPYTDLWYALLTAQDKKCVHIGAQNMHYEESGAYTGEVAPEMLSCLHVEYVIIGHSERRQYFNETDETVNLKVKAALKHGLSPIVCVGESLDEREKNKTKAVVTKQIHKALEGLTREELENIIVAYEPIWAIGTGKTATSQQADETIKLIRDQIEKDFGTDAVSILYGGSVKKENAKELFDMPNIDGGLVGGASLKVDDFAEICNS